MAARPIPRPSARVLVTGPDGALLLFQFQPPEGHSSLSAGPSFWITPGGGIQRDETVAEAAARELREEVGIIVRPQELGPVVASASGPWSASGRVYDAHDSFFWLRVADKTVDTAGQEDLERSLILGHRWWTVDDLSATTDVVYPIGAASLLRTLLTSGAPAKPVLLPWQPDS